MLWGFVFALIIAVTMGFMASSYRFERSIRATRLKPLSSHPLVSVLIPTFRSEGEIARTLRSLQSSDYPNKEIIVINDSIDKTPEIARSFGARVIQNDKRGGKGAALNIGEKEAGGDLLLVLDSDTVMSKGTLSSLVRSYQSYEDKGEKVGIVAPRYNASNKRNLFARLSDMEQGLHQNLMKVQMNLGSILSIRGSCMLINRQAFSEAGGFSPTLLEDGDFTAKVFKSGFSIKYEPRASVSIKEPETFRSLFNAKKRYGKGTFYCVLTHYRPYVISPQALVCFFPQFLLALAVVGTLVLQNPLTLAPITILLSSMTFSGATSYLLIGLVALVSTMGAIFGSQALSVTQAAAKPGIMGTVLPFVLFFIPLVTVAYARGFISGVMDKRNGRPELEFSNW